MRKVVRHTTAAAQALLGWRSALLGLALVLVGLVATACNAGTGTYPFDVFPEMHYQQSYKPQEPPRLLPPEGSVPRSTPEPRASGARLFEANCAMCHGAQGRGEGPVLQRIIEDYNYAPAMNPDLTSVEAQAVPDDGIIQIISGGVVVMPTFQNLLTEEEINLLVDHIRALP